MQNEYLNIFAFEKIYEYLDKGIYLSKYIGIYSNIQIFASHWLCYLMMRTALMQFYLMTQTDNVT